MRRRRDGRLRALRAAVLGDPDMSAETARRLSAGRLAQVILSSPSTGQADRARRDLDPGIQHVVNLGDTGPVDVLIVCESPSTPYEATVSRARDVAMWAVRTCPDTALILAAPAALSLSRHALRASGLIPHLILSPGALPSGARAARRLARDLGLHTAQIDTLAIGGDEPSSIRHLERYTAVGGIPISDLGGRPALAGMTAGRGGVPAGALVGAAVEIARAVLRDSRKVLCCGGWAEGAYGLEGTYVSAPFRVGARGAEAPLPLALTLEERSLLQRAGGQDDAAFRG